MKVAVAVMPARARCGAGSAAISPPVPIQDLDQYRAAMAHAEGDPVREVTASAVTRAMTLWFPDTETWFVVAGKPTTAPQPGGLITYNRTMTFIPIEVGPNGRVTRFWEVLADRVLIQRFPHWPGA